MFNEECWSGRSGSGQGCTLHVPPDPVQLIAHSGCHVNSTLKTTIEATSLKIVIGLE